MSSSPSAVVARSLALAVLWPSAASPQHVDVIVEIAVKGDRFLIFIRAHHFTKSSMGFHC